MAYHDPFNSFLTTWLLTQSLSDRANWAYNHRNEMDESRYRDMVSKDKELEARLKELEAKGTPRDPNYIPPAMKDNPDLMYSEDFVKAAAPQPEIKATASPTRPTPRTFNKIFLGLLIVSIIMAVVLGYLVFFRKEN